MGKGLVDKPHLQRFKTHLDNTFVKKTEKATLDSFGIVKPDGISVTVADGVLSASASGVNYSEIEQLLGITWINNERLYQSTIVMRNPVSCTAGQWNEICDTPNEIDMLIKGEYTDGAISGGTQIKKENGKIYVCPSINCNVKYLTISYTKDIEEFIYDYTWTEASAKNWDDFIDTKWKGVS